jgi:hypothetical protein
MKEYIGVKLIKAKPMNSLEAFNLLGRVHKQENAPGYLVEYEDGYKSWSPKDIFEKSHLEFIPITTISGEVVSLHEEMAEKFIYSYESDNDPDLDVCTVTAKTINGLTYIETDSEYYDVDYSQYETKEKFCLEMIKDKILRDLNFLTNCAINGFKIKE